MQNVPGYKRVPLGRLTAEGLLVVNRPLDVTAQRYIDSDSPVFATAGTMEFQTGLQWCSIIVAVTGAPTSSTAISVENVLHVECIPRATSIGQSTPAAKYNTAALGGASNAASKATAAVLDSEKGKRVAEVVEAAKTGIAAAGGGVGYGKAPNIKLARKYSPYKGGGRTIVRAGKALFGLVDKFGNFLTNP